jgi:hypothetical protein
LVIMAPSVTPDHRFGDRAAGVQVGAGPRKIANDQHSADVRTQHARAIPVKYLPKVDMVGGRILDGRHSERDADIDLSSG